MTQGSLAHHLAYFAHLAATAGGAAAIFALANRGSMPRWASALLALGCVGMALAAFRLSDPPRVFSDFWIAYYPAGQAALNDPARLNALLAKGVDGFVNIPILAWAFAPFGAFPPGPAAALFTSIGVALTVAAWMLLCRLAELAPRERWLLALLMAANGPLQYSLREGNTSHMVLFALAAGLALLRARRNLAAGLLLGAATVLKPPLILFGAFFVLRRDVRGAAGYAAAGAAAALGSLALYGWDVNLRWFELCVVEFSRHWLAAFNVQSIPAFILRLGSGAAHLNDWNVVPTIAHERLLGQLLTLGVLALAGAACLPSTARRQDAAAASMRQDLEYLLVIGLVVVASPLSWSHYYAWPLMPAAFFLGSGWYADTRAARALGWTAIGLITPLIWPLSFTDPLAADVYRTLGVSHLLFGGLLMCALLALRIRQSQAIATPERSTTVKPPNEMARPSGARTVGP